MMVKIIVHESFHKGPGMHDVDRDFYIPIEHVNRVYCNIKDFDFNNIIYKAAVLNIKSKIEKANELEEVYGGGTETKGFDENDDKEELNRKLADFICKELNEAAADEIFSRGWIEPYKTVKTRVWSDCYHINEYYAPKESECCYDITDVFLNTPNIEEQYLSFISPDSWEDKQSYYGTDIQTVWAKKDHCKRIKELNEKIEQLERSLELIKGHIAHGNLQGKSFCKFILPYVKSTPHVNKKIDSVLTVIDSEFKLISHNEFYYHDKGLYPLNIALELNDTDLIFKLIEKGAYKLTAGNFYDRLNPCKYPLVHRYERLFEICDALHAKILRYNLGNDMEWVKQLPKEDPLII